MNLSQLDKILAAEPKFRSKQAKQLIWRDLIENWDQASTLPVELRKKLTEECPLEIKAEVFPDKDGRSAKALIALKDELNVETVLMRHGAGGIGVSLSGNHAIPVPPDGGTPPFAQRQSRRPGMANYRNTVCVSSQVGCPLGCLFCATGKMGFKRNLSANEIMEQVLFWSRWLKKNDISPFIKGGLRGISKSSPTLLLQRRESERVNNIVFMGMGEPFLNYDNVLEAVKTLNDDNLLGVGARHISISTAGIIEGIERMAEDMPQINLAISLHAPNDKLRQELMPIAKKYPLASLMAAAENYIERTNRKLMFEYIMIKGMNDSADNAKELAKLLNKRLFFVNLIAYNPTGGLTPSEPAQIKNFKDILMKAGVQALERYRFGQDIQGACGQLAGKNKDI